MKKVFISYLIAILISFVESVPPPNEANLTAFNLRRARTEYVRQFNAFHHQQAQATIRREEEAENRRRHQAEEAERRRSQEEEAADNRRREQEAATEIRRRQQESAVERTRRHLEAAEERLRNQSANVEQARVQEQQTQLRFKWNQIPICGICFEPIIIDPDRSVIALTCGHTFCANCIREIFEIRVRTTCPKCRQNINLNYKIRLFFEFDENYNHTNGNCHN